MQNSILVLTPQPSFGELIRQSLEETGRYRVEVEYQAAEALVRCRRPGSYRLIILDGDLLPGAPLDRLIADLRASQPEARLALIPPENPRNPQAIPDLPVDGALSKPFYLPSLVVTIDRLIAGEAAGETPAATAAGRVISGIWPREAEACRAELARVMAAAGAVGALLMDHGAIRAETGCAGGAWSTELLARLCAPPDRAGDAELVLLQKSPDGAGMALVYAVDRREAGTLALVFPDGTTYSQARARTHQTIQVCLGTNGELK